MSDEGLKPCPFCGGKAELTEWHGGNEYSHGWWVICEECGVYADFHTSEKRVAIKAWNERSEPADMIHISPKLKKAALEWMENGERVGMTIKFGETGE